ncbi:TRAP transporter large permease subunit [Enterococcus sp. AZ109]|uniref:TRAP transporter large permease subunit n=1 Tax=Enterococcus sp. AZ109 TaxID=2774634 RepID=UPI003F1F1616
MGIGITALIVFIGVILVWFLIFKRSIGEAMMLGFLAICALGGGDAIQLFIEGIEYAATYEVLYAALAFVVMAYVFDISGVLEGLINILNSLLGRVPGGAAFMDVIASGALGLISGSTTGNVAARGVFTIPWMKKTGFSDDLATTIASGNAGMAVGFPPNASMFILLGLAPIAAQVSEGQLYMAMLVAGTYQIIYRFVIVAFFIKKYKIKGVSEGIMPLKQSIKAGWTSLFVFLGAAIPILLTMSPIGAYLSSENVVGSEGMGTISLITWMPIVISIICIVLGWKNFPKKASGWVELSSKCIGKFSSIGAVLLFAFAASNVLTNLGMGEELTAFLGSLAIAPWMMVMIVGAIVVLVACPLSSTATLTVVGLVAFSALTSVGVNAVVAVAAILAWASTEGESMPTSGGIYVAAGIAEANPAKSFVPLFVYYVIPVMVIGWMMAWGVLPLPV